MLELNVEDGILEEIEFSGVFLDPMASWNYTQPEVLELKMEELVATRYECGPGSSSTMDCWFHIGQ